MGFQISSCQRVATKWESKKLLNFWYSFFNKLHQNNSCLRCPLILLNSLHCKFQHCSRVLVVCVDGHKRNLVVKCIDNELRAGFRVTNEEKQVVIQVKTLPEAGNIITREDRNVGVIGQLEFVRGTLE